MTSAVNEVAAPTHVKARFDSSLVHGIAWTSGAKWLSQVTRWASTIAVARLLTPADYGLVGMALLYLELVTLVHELGLGGAVVTKRRLTTNQIAQLNSLSVLLGVVGFAASYLAAVPVSIFFELPQLRAVIVVMSVSCVITAFRAVPSALLERELSFKTLAIMEGVQAMVAALGVLIFAVLGLGYWALVLAGVLAKAVWTAMVLTTRRHSFAWPHWRSLRDPLAFSWHLLVSRLSWYAQANGDYVVAGRVFGKELLGAYSMAFTIASVPTEKITSMVGRVAFPLFSSVQREPAELRRYLLSLTEGLALLTFPLAFGLALVAGDFVVAVLGERWVVAIAPLRFLAFLTLLQAIVPLLPHVLNVIGESRFAMRVGVVSGVVLPLAFFVGSRWGLVGIAAMWVTVYPALTVPLYRRVFRALEIPASVYLRVLWPGLSASLVMSAAVWGLRAEMPIEWSPLLRLTAQVATGGLVYSAVIVSIHRKHLHSFRRAWQMVRGSSA